MNKHNPFQTSSSSYGSYYTSNHKQPPKPNTNKLNNNQSPSSYQSPYQRVTNVYNPNYNQVINNTPYINQKGFASTSQSLYEDIINTKVGLCNLGNTCFMNACLQILIHCPIFIKQFLVQEKQIKQKPISSQFFELLINAVSSPYLEYLTPQIFKDHFDQLHQQFTNYEQHDSEEFCRLFLQDINNELNRITNPIPSKALSQSGNKHTLYNDFKKDFNQRESSIVTDIFYSTFLNIYKCYCGHELYSFANYSDIPIELNPYQDKQILTDMLKNAILKQERINFNSEKCPRCHMSNRTKTTSICSVPQVLILSLQRYNQKTQTKNNAEILFEDKINLGALINRECGDNNITSTSYSLFGIINHMGSLDSGHYYSTIKIKGDWYTFDDSKVSKCIYTPYASKEVYSLFYLKQ